MLKALRLIRVCDHKINETETNSIDKKIVRGSESFDIIDNASVASIVRVSTPLYGDQTALYEEGIDYRKHTHNKILWFGPDAPYEGTEYDISYTTKSFNVNQYDAESCVRCSGMGWYASIVDSSNKRADYINGVEKLCQDIIKIMLTDKLDSGYGSSITEDIKDNDLSDKAAIASKVKFNVNNIENYYKDTQSSIISDGVTLSPDEILRRIEIEDIYTDVDAGAVIVNLIIYNESLESVEISVAI